MGIKWKNDYRAETQRWFGICIGLVCGLLFVAIVEAFRAKEIQWASWAAALGSTLAAVVALWLGLSERSLRKQERREAASFYLGSHRARVTSLRSEVLELIVETSSLPYTGVPWPFQGSRDSIAKIVEEIRGLITPAVALSFPVAASTLIQICDELVLASESLNEPNMKGFVSAAGGAERLMAKFSTYRFLVS